MKIGLWTDSHNFPSLPLMKLSAYHKQRGDDVSMYMPIEHYDVVYASKVFSFTPDIDDMYVVHTDKLYKGGTGYCISVADDKEVFSTEPNTNLPVDVEHIYPDYGLFPQYKYAVGYLTRGCPRACGFCVVSQKEGRCSQQVAELSEFWRGQRYVKLLDPNILACRNHEQLLQTLAESHACVDFTQGLDIRLTNTDNIKLLNAVRTTSYHFAWDNPSEDLTDAFVQFLKYTEQKDERKRIVYVLTNYDSTLDEDLYRIYTLRDIGYTPYVMIYRKETAPREIRRLQRWCNNRRIFRTCTDFKYYSE